MEKLSIQELKDLFESVSPRQFVLSSHNQPTWNSAVSNTIIFNLTFTTMLIAFNPNTVCFKNGVDYMCLERVKFIKMIDRNSVLGIVFAVICGDSGNNSNDVEYTIVAR